jgi:hypothetical protein
VLQDGFLGRQELNLFEGLQAKQIAQHQGHLVTNAARRIEVGEFPVECTPVGKIGGGVPEFHPLEIAKLARNSIDVRQLRGDAVQYLGAVRLLDFGCLLDFLELGLDRPGVGRVDRRNDAGGLAQHVAIAGQRVLARSQGLFQCRQHVLDAVCRGVVYRLAKMMRQMGASEFVKVLRAYRFAQARNFVRSSGLLPLIISYMSS